MILQPATSDHIKTTFSSLFFTSDFLLFSFECMKDLFVCFFLFLLTRPVM
ncbi:hypothetical protein IC582_003181 [Cucumis melo]